MHNENVKKNYLKFLFVNIQSNEENVFVKLKFELFLRKLKFHHKQERMNYIDQYVILHFFSTASSGSMSLCQYPFLPVMF
jgi:hypothetical protein